MAEQLRTYVVEARWCDDDQGWQTSEVEYDETTLEVAWRRATQMATQLDETYGDSHFWSVDVKNPVGQSYVQLFHGRLS